MSNDIVYELSDKLHNLIKDTTSYREGMMSKNWSQYNLEVFIIRSLFIILSILGYYIKFKKIIFL